MNPGTQVIYVPTLAAGDITHPDCIRGFIVGPAMGRSVYVLFWREVGVSLRTERPQLTDSDRLVMADSVERGNVEVWLR